MTKKMVLIVVSVMTLICLSSSAFAANFWDIPNNVRIVQKSGADNVRVFSTIQAAINSITNASATNPYVVKVMPGVYDLGTASVQMKEYVDVEGSGPENTIITSSNVNANDGTCVAGTVLMINNSSIRHIKIVNMPPAQLVGSYARAAAIVFNEGVVAKAEGIGVLVGDGNVLGGDNHGICISGEFAHAILNNVNVEAHNYGNYSRAISGCGSLTLTNSKLAAFNTTGTVSVLSMGCGTLMTVINSTIEGTADALNVLGINAGPNNKVSISNSTITLNGGTWVNLMFATGDFSMVNSKFISDGVATCQYQGGTTKIANSLLTGNLLLNGAKLVNNYDANFNPIPNQ